MTATATQLILDFDQSDTEIDDDRWFAYYGGPDQRVWGRVEFQTKSHFLSAAWNESYLYGEHSAKEDTCASRLWTKHIEKVNK